MQLADLAALRTAYRRGGLRPTDVAHLVLDRVAARGDDAVWISLVSREALLARAAHLTERDAADLPLYGVPFAVKDNIDVAGLATTAGCPDFAYLPAVTAPVVRRLLDAGAMLVGKTNMDQFATGLTGCRTPYGVCESVFGGGLIAGGSSSGSAVAVAADLVSFSLGTDTAGSGRVPAAMNGIVGVKPTRGLLSTAGVVPACRSLDCVSIFAADVASGATVLDVARGFCPDDPWSRPVPSQPRAAAPVHTLRLGVPAGADREFFGDTGQRHRYAAGVDRAARACATVEQVSLAPLLEAGDLLYRGPWVAERLVVLDDHLRARPETVHPVTRRVLEAGRAYDAVAAFRALHRLRELRATVDRLWERLDVLLLPTIGTTFTIDEIAAEPVERNLMLGRYTQFANLLDLAVVTVHNGVTEHGAPASLSLIGPALREPTLLALAAALASGAPPSAGDLARVPAGDLARVPASDQARDRAGVPASGAAASGDSADPGRTGQPAADLTARRPGAETMSLAVVGRHLAGESRNVELVECGATLAYRTRTAPLYRLYRLADGSPDGLPALVRVPAAGVPIDVEVWQVPSAAVGRLLSGVPAPLSLGWVRLADGRQVLGFLGEAYAVATGTDRFIAGTGGSDAGTGGSDAGTDRSDAGTGGFEDISAAGGWRAYRRALAGP